MYDILIRGGHVLDPLHNVDGSLDVAIEGGHVVRTGADLDVMAARQVLDASGMLVVPGLIDMHVHVHWGVSHYGIDADASCLAHGVTTAVDAGSAGAYTYPSLKRWIIDASQTELYAFLNIAYPGMIGDQIGELEDERNLDEALAIRVARAPEILGIKARMDRVGAHRAPDILARAIGVAEAVGKPVMVHIGSARRMNAPLDAVLELLRCGDIVTHMYHGKDGGLIDEGGRDEGVQSARQRGVLFDVGHGAGSLALRGTGGAEQGFVPDIISAICIPIVCYSSVIISRRSQVLCMGMSLVMSSRAPQPPLRHVSARRVACHLMER